MNAAEPARDPVLVRMATRWASRAAPLLRAAGVEPATFRLLLRTKMILDRRVVEGMTPGRRLLRQAGLALITVMYVHFGLAGGALALVVDDAFVFGAATWALVALLVSFPLLLEFSTFLLDGADLDVVATLPVGDRTMLAVRYVHLGSYVGFLLAALTLPALPFLAFAGWGLAAPVAFALVALSATGTIVFGVSLVFVFALRFASPSRIEDLLVWLQVVLFAGFYAVSQLLPHVLGEESVRSWFDRHPSAWRALPPVWGGSLLAVLTRQGGEVLPAVLAVAVPVGLALGLFLLSRTGVVPGLIAQTREAGRGRRGPRRFGITGRLETLVTRGPVERAGFLFFLACSAGDRSYKRRAYPAMVPMVLWVGPVLLSDGSRLLAKFGGVVTLLLGLLPLVALGHAEYGENARARWIFDTMSARARGEFARGTAKAVLIRFFVLPALVVVPVAVLVTSVERLPVLLLGLAVGGALAVAGSRRLVRTIPFTRAQESVRMGALSGTTVVFLFLALGAMPVVGALGISPIATGVGLAVASLLLAAESARFVSSVPEIAPVDDVVVD